MTPASARAMPAARRSTWFQWIVCAAGFIVIASAFIPYVAQRAALPSGVRSPFPTQADEYGLLQLTWSQDVPSGGAALNRASPMGQEPSLWHPWLWLLGGLSRAVDALFGPVPPDVAWAMLGAGAALGALGALVVFAGVVLPPGRARTLTVLLVILCGGWRWLHFLPLALGVIGKPIYADQFWGTPADAFERGTAFGGPLVDAWAAPERLFLLTGEAALLALIVLACRAAAWRPAALLWAGAGLVLAILQPVSPGTFRVAAIATGLVVVGELVLGTGGLAPRLSRALGCAVMLVVAWPAHAYFLNLPRREPAWEYLWTRADTVVMHPGHVLVALGTVAAGGLVWMVVRTGGGRTSLRPGSAGILAAWGLCAMFAPSVSILVGDVRSLDVAALAMLPLASLTADLLIVGIGSVVGPVAGGVILGLAMLVNLPSLGFYTVAAVARAQAPRLVVEATDAAVLESLNALPLAGAVVLTSSPDLDRAVLAATDKRITAGWLTALRGHAGLLRREFFDESASEARQAELLEAIGVRYVLYDATDVAPPHPNPRIRPVARGTKLALLAVAAPAGTPPVAVAGDVLRNPSGSIYYFDGRRRHWVPDIATFDAHGFSWDRVRHVDGWWLATVPEGYPLAKGSSGDAPTRPN